MSKSRQGDSPNGRVNNIARRKADAVLELPAGPFAFADIGPLRSFVHEFRETAIVEKVNTRERWAGNSKRVHEYQVRPLAKRAAQEMKKDREPACPCGHSGVRNLGDRYVCGFRFCPNTYDRDDLEVDR